MSRRVKISTMGVEPPHIREAESGRVFETMRDFWRRKLDAVLPDRPDLIVLPELCDSYLGQPAAGMQEVAREHSANFLEFFRGIASAHRCNIAYSSLLPAGDNAFLNNTRLINRGGDIIGEYNKNHLTIPEIEELGMLGGESAPIIECDFGRVACVTCFDLNFDELRLRYVAAQPDLLIYPSMSHGGIQQEYWAYTCRAHLVSAIGIKGIYSGIIAPTTQKLASTTYQYDCVTATVNLDCCLAHLDGNVEKLAALKAKYGPAVTITDPEGIASVLITSETENKSARELAEEFAIELLDDYLRRSRAIQCLAQNRESRINA